MEAKGEQPQLLDGRNQWADHRGTVKEINLVLQRWAEAPKADSATQKRKPPLVSQRGFLD